MPVSGLIVRLGEGALGAAGLAAMRARAELTVGRADGRHLPVAVEARDVAHSRELHDWLTALPGVEFVDVVCVNFEES